MRNKSPFLLRKPCGNCPFRTDVTPFIKADRVGEILHPHNTSGFVCHNTVDYGSMALAEGVTFDDDDSEHYDGNGRITKKIAAVRWSDDRLDARWPAKWNHADRRASWILFPRSIGHECSGLQGH